MALALALAQKKMKAEWRIRPAQKGREKELEGCLGMSARWALVGERGSNPVDWEQEKEGENWDEKQTHHEKDFLRSL